MSDLISRKKALDAVNAYLGLSAVSRTIQNMTSIQEILENLPSAEPKTPSNGSITSMNPENTHDRTMDGLIRRQDVLHELDGCDYELKDWQRWKLKTMVRDIPSAEKAQLPEEDATSELISRQDAIDAIFSEPLYESGMKKRDADAVVPAIYEKIKSLQSAEKTQLSEEDATSVCKCPCEYREPCDYCHYDAYREHGCPAEEGMKDE